MSYLGKEYKLYKKENADGILKFLGVTDDQLEAVNSFNPPEKFTKNGDTYTYYTENEKGPAEIKFKSGVEIDYDLWDEPSKTTFVVDGNTITQTVKTDKHTSVFKREFNGDELVATFSATGYNGEVKFFYRV